MILRKNAIWHMLSIIFLLGLLPQTVFASYQKTYEAEENTDLVTSVASTNHTGFSGSGFIDFGSSNSSVMWEKINVLLDGNYTLSFQYANGADDGVARPCTVEVNGTKLGKDLEMKSTGDWSTWKTENISATLKSGDNTIKLASIGAGPNIDYVLVTDGEVPLETVIAKFDAPLDQLNYLSGFLHGWDTSASIPNDLITELKPQYHRVAPGQAKLQKDRSEKLGVTVISVLSDGWGYNGKNGWPGDGGDWTAYDNFLTDRYNEIITAGYDLKNIHFDIWNEANGTGFWNPEGGDVAKNRARFIETWVHAYRMLKELNPNCIIEGPSLSDIWYKPLKGDVSYPFMTAWIKAVVANDCIPEYITWHFPGNASKHWNASNPTNPSKEVENVRNIFAAQGKTCPPIIINEYLYEEDQSPGTAAWNLAQLQRVDVQGVCHAIWGTTYQLDQLIIKNGSSWLKKGEYWMGSCYAKMAGTRVDTVNSDNIDLVAVKDSDTHKAYVLLGNKGGLTGNVKVSLQKMNFFNSFNVDKVHVLVQRIPYDEGGEISGLDTILEEDYPINTNSIDLNVDWADDNDAYYVTAYAVNSTTTCSVNASLVGADGKELTNMNTDTVEAVIDIESIGSNTSVMAILAVYNDQKSLIGIRKMPINVGDKEVTLELTGLTANSSNYAKVFIWDSLSSMLPRKEVDKFFTD